MLRYQVFIASLSQIVVIIIVTLRYIMYIIVLISGIIILYLRRVFSFVICRGLFAESITVIWFERVLRSEDVDIKLHEWTAVLLKIAETMLIKYNVT